MVVKKEWVCGTRKTEEEGVSGQSVLVPPG
jgi:hypothetical protein